MTAVGNGGIRSYAAFVPRLRIAKAAIADAHGWALPALKNLARGERALCSWDEDSITMAVQAGRDCLRGLGSARPAELVFASTTAPFADPPNASIVSLALRLEPHVACQDVSGATRAGLRALAQALEAASDRLIVAADNRHARPGSPQEMTYGAGAAAFLTGTGDDVIARYLGRHTETLPFVDHFREVGTSYDYYWEERWIRDEGVMRIMPAAVSSLLERLALPVERVAWLGLTGIPAGSDKQVAKAVGIRPERLLPDLQSTVGDTGAAHGMLLLASALERGKPGDIVVVGSLGAGCELLAFELTDVAFRPVRGVAEAIADRQAETSYTKMLTFGGELKLDWGPRAEVQIKASLSQQYRSAGQLLGFVAGRCTACGQVQFPQLVNCVSCASNLPLLPMPLADEPARIATVSADWLQYYPAPPLYVGLIQFDLGARILMEIVNVAPTGIGVAAPVQFVFRLKAHDDLRHYTRYFWKAVPVRSAAPATSE